MVLSPPPPPGDFLKQYERRSRYPEIFIDSSGLPLIPQPTPVSDDPLSYPDWVKWTTLAQISTSAFLAALNISIIIPALQIVSSELKVSATGGSQQITVAFAASALGPIILTPLARIYGRRSILLLSTFIGCLGTIGCAAAKSFPVLLIARIISAFGLSPALVLGVGTVVDMFFTHQRGRAIGAWALALTTGTHLGPILGGYITRALGWRFMFVIYALALPETIFVRPLDTRVSFSAPPPMTNDSSDEVVSIDNANPVPFKAPPINFSTYRSRLSLYRRPTALDSAPQRATWALEMLKYPSVVFPAFYYTITYGYAGMEPALTLATIFSELYSINQVRNGLFNGLSLLVGASLGELFSGPVTDKLISIARHRTTDKGKRVSAELRLRCVSLWLGALSLPVDVSSLRACYFDDKNCGADGLTVHFGTAYISPCIGMAVACFGIQIVTSLIPTALRSYAQFLLGIIWRSNWVPMVVYFFRCHMHTRLHSYDYADDLGRKMEDAYVMKDFLG
ncbi:major facilitator superfamily domain-containing protein [Mycena floridula]|nr:major facilitator superfamily domain-containing protein [Mycena floridula]